VTAVADGIPKSERARKQLLRRLIEEQQAELEAENRRWESRYDHIDDHEKEIHPQQNYIREKKYEERKARGDAKRKF